MYLSIGIAVLAYTDTTMMSRVWLLLLSWSAVCGIYGFIFYSRESRKASNQNRDMDRENQKVLERKS